MMKIAILASDTRETFRNYTDCEPGFHPAVEALLTGMGQLRDVEVHVISCVQREVQAPERLAPNVFYHSLRVPRIGWLRTGYLGCIRAVREKLAQLQPDLVHGQGTERDCAVSAVFSGYPNVLTIHGNVRLLADVNKSRFLSYWWIMARLEGLTIPRTDGVISLTSYTDLAVKNLARRTWIVPNGVDSSLFHLARRERFPPEILCVGVICPRKNQNWLIRTLDGTATCRRFLLKFLGQTEVGTAYTLEFSALIKQRSWCLFDGFASRQKLAECLATAAMLVVPSVEENCPMVILEAMAAGVPVIAANVGGIPDLVTSGETGWLFNSLEESEVSKLITKILDAPDEAKEVAGKAREHAGHFFHPVNIAEKHIEIYREILKAKGREIDFDGGKTELRKHY